MRVEDELLSQRPLQPEIRSRSIGWIPLGTTPKTRTQGWNKSLCGTTSILQKPVKKKEKRATRRGKKVLAVSVKTGGGG